LEVLCVSTSDKPFIAEKIRNARRAGWFTKPGDLLEPALNSCLGNQLGSCIKGEEFKRMEVRASKIFDAAQVDDTNKRSHNFCALVTNRLTSPQKIVIIPHHLQSYLMVGWRNRSLWPNNWSSTERLLGQQIVSNVPESDGAQGEGLEGRSSARSGYAGDC
jgi:hypothetical protein